MNDMFLYLDSIPLDEKIKLLIGIKYDSKQMDFGNMMMNPYFNDFIFIFNDNYTDHHTCIEGGGNAEFRKFNNYSSLMKPRSFGIPTGNYREGYRSLNESILYINQCIFELTKLIKHFKYTGIVYSIDNIGNPLFGTGIFKDTINPLVLKYITKCILKISFGGKYSNFSTEYNNSSSVDITQDIINYMS